MHYWDFDRDFEAINYTDVSICTTMHLALLNRNVECVSPRMVISLRSPYKKGELIYSLSFCKLDHFNVL